MLPTIVTVAYNRPHTLQRLLASLATADYPSAEVRLVISVDGGGQAGAAVRQIAADFVWPFGPKELIFHEHNLGLITHLFGCGDLAEREGSIILLEDDLVVSPRFYAYAAAGLDFYAADEQIAGLSLNALWFNGFRHWPFVPYLDDGDIFFMQVAWFQGQAYTAAQWHTFRTWFAANQRPITAADGLHPLFGQFPPTDWFPLKTRYLHHTGRFYAFPRESLTVNFGEVGTHFDHQTSFFQVPLQTRRTQFRYQPLATAVAVYDAYQEMVADRLKQLNPALAGYDFVVDLNGTRPLDYIPTPYLLTTRPSRRPVASFGLQMRPPEANIAHNIAGRDIVLTAVADVDGRWLPNWRTKRRDRTYHSR